MKRRALSGLNAILLGSLLFALMAVLVHFVSEATPVGQLVVVRFAVGIAGTVSLLALQRRRPNLCHWPLLGLRGALGGMAVLLYFFAIGRLGAGPATLFNYLSPVYAALFAYLFLKERPGVLFYVGLAIATVGAALVALGTGSLGHPLTPSLGLVAGVLSGLLGGAAMTVVHTLRRDTDAATVFLSFCTVGLVLAAPFAAVDWVWLSPPLWLGVIGVGVFSLFAQLLYTWGMGFTTASRGAAATQATPALVWALSVVVLGKWPNLLTAAGSALAVIGVLLGMLPGRGEQTVNVDATAADT